MTEQYRFNPACAEQRTSKAILESLTVAEQKAFCTMTPEETEYLTKDCFIFDYINYLRKGKENKAVGEDFPILVVKGTPLQLERFRITFLISLIDFHGFKFFYPSDFALGEEALEELRKYTGVAFIKIPIGASTSEGLDIHRTELITGVLATRRDLFNPSIVLAEENISGKFSVSNSLIRIVRLENNKLRGDYKDNSTQYSDALASRVKKEPVYTTSKSKEVNYHTNNNAIKQKIKSGKKLSVNDKLKLYNED